MKAWLATARSGDSGKIWPPGAAREEDVRQQATSAASCYFTDLWRLNEQKKRGAPSKEFAERERACSALVAAYMASYDVSTNPMAADGGGAGGGGGGGRSGGGTPLKMAS